MQNKPTNIIVTMGIITNFIADGKISRLLSRWLSFSSRAIASPKTYMEVIGAVCRLQLSWFWMVYIIVLPLVSILLTDIISPERSFDWHYLYDWRQLHEMVLTEPRLLLNHSLFKLFLLNFFTVYAIRTCRRLLKVFSLRRKDRAITNCYICILATIGIWILLFLVIFNCKDSKIGLTTATILGVVLTWIFQDTVKGVVSYFHLRTHDLLKVGDWIQTLDGKIDGQITKITLQSVTVSNWDTTTTVVSLTKLHSDNFVNLQNMMEGKTHGRRMYKSFRLDTSCFHSLTAEEADILSKHPSVSRYLQPNEIVEGAGNNSLLRRYLYHWLMDHPHISRQPRLIVRWLEPTEHGMPLQVYAFIMDSGLVAFEWQQSQIIEHIIEALQWFGLSLYQRPSTRNVSDFKHLS